MRFQRDITTDGGGGYTEHYYDKDKDFYIKQVRSKHEGAFMRRTIKNGLYCYQVGYRKNLFWFKEIGDTHLFSEQAWHSAYYALYLK
jgi:hypothetical protein